MGLDELTSDQMQRLQDDSSAQSTPRENKGGRHREYASKETIEACSDIVRQVRHHHNGAGVPTPGGLFRVLDIPAAIAGDLMGDILPSINNMEKERPPEEATKKKGRQPTHRPGHRDTELTSKKLCDFHHLSSKSLIILVFFSI